MGETDSAGAAGADTEAPPPDEAAAPDDAGAHDDAAAPFRAAAPDGLAEPADGDRVGALRPATARTAAGGACSFGGEVVRAGAGALGGGVGAALGSGGGLAVALGTVGAALAAAGTRGAGGVGVTRPVERATAKPLRLAGAGNAAAAGELGVPRCRCPGTGAARGGRGPVAVARPGGSATAGCVSLSSSSCTRSAMIERKRRASHPAPWDCTAPPPRAARRSSGALHRGPHAPPAAQAGASWPVARRSLVRTGS